MFIQENLARTARVCGTWTMTQHLPPPFQFSMMETPLQAGTDKNSGLPYPQLQVKGYGIFPKEAGVCLFLPHNYMLQKLISRTVQKMGLGLPALLSFHS